ncbi:hypothetical protein P4H94_13465 [Paenibacillus macerans]|uniref:Lipoprotein n=1 Tax=Paenibacillus macerans TaxID=44252 RepID=A0A090YNR8_PAEMA|nr:hypothetical protein [Paenibacillus macerans]KFM93790.1 hypothetical protein DJ90_6015 [Paenibacillus macerans]MBS5915075.1 hypothetical protein [Paenibacillus macerans]MCY7562082.1 hypothetical protein [Paenibacillus macerans]MEC0137878.1 hypothetical protein [Paenibacillus macerans]MEC0153827.1 hypothetical protein [Paenibacillus macerans]
MKKEIGVLITSVVLLAGCSSDKPATVTQGAGESPSKQVTTQPEQETNAKLLGSSENKNVKLYETTDGVIVDVNGSQKKFDWRILKGVSKPRVSYVDLTGDGKEEVVVILVTGHGTNLGTNEAHVLNGENLSEIKVQNVEEILADLENEVKQNGNELLIKAKAQGKEYKFSKNVSELPLAHKADDKFENKLYFGDMILNDLKDQQLIVNIGGYVYPINRALPDHVCTVHVTYKYDQVLNEFVADQIEVTPDE